MHTGLKFSWSFTANGFIRLPYFLGKGVSKGKTLLFIVILSPVLERWFTTVSEQECSEDWKLIRMDAHPRATTSQATVVLH